MDIILFQLIFLKDKYIVNPLFYRQIYYNLSFKNIKIILSLNYYLMYLYFAGSGVGDFF